MKCLETERYKRTDRRTDTTKCIISLASRSINMCKKRFLLQGVSLLVILGNKVIYLVTACLYLGMFLSRGTTFTICVNMCVRKFSEKGALFRVRLRSG